MLRPGTNQVRETNREAFMEPIESQKCASKHPAKRREKLVAARQRIRIGDCDGPGEMSQVVDQIMEAWGLGVGTVELEFSEVNQMPPNAALRLHEALKQKPTATRLITRAYSPIIGSGVLVWLGSRDPQVSRWIRPTTWFFFQRLSAVRHRRRFPWEEEAEPWSRTQTDAIPDFITMDYRTVLDLVNDYLPVEGIAGRVLTPALLDEFCLLDVDLMQASRVRSPRDPMNQASRMAEEDIKEKRVWFIERNERGYFTLKGGYTLTNMNEDPDLRNMDIGVNFPTKQDLLNHLDQIGFCADGDKVIMDGDQVARS